MVAYIKVPFEGVGGEKPLKYNTSLQGFWQQLLCMCHCKAITTSQLKMKNVFEIIINDLYVPVIQLDRSGECFPCFCNKFPNVIDTKVNHRSLSAHKLWKSHLTILKLTLTPLNWLLGNQVTGLWPSGQQKGGKVVKIIKVCCRTTGS